MISSHRSPYSIPAAFASFGSRLAAVMPGRVLSLIHIFKIMTMIENKIRKRRQELNMSRVQLAEAVQVTPSAIANYESTRSMENMMM